MRSTTIELDPRRTAEYEEPEGDERNGSWISPFEVPTRIFLECDPGVGVADIRWVRFDYPGGETGRAGEDLDGRDDPRVEVLSGWLTGKILRLTFSRPISLDEFAQIGERLRVRADTFNSKATIFNYRMIAAILRDWRRAVQPLD